MKTRGSRLKSVIALVLVCSIITNGVFYSGYAKGAEVGTKLKQDSITNLGNQVRDMARENIGRIVEKHTSKWYHKREKAKSYILTAKTEKSKHLLREVYSDYVMDDYSKYTGKTGAFNMSLLKSEIDRFKLLHSDIVIEPDVIVDACDIENDNNVTSESDSYDCNEVEEKDITDQDKYNWNDKIINVDDVVENMDSEQDELQNADLENRVKVAIIDSGIDSSTDVSVAKSINFLPGEEELTTFFEDATGHGTSIAGIIAASNDHVGITGINPNVLIYSAKVFDDTNSAALSRILEGIYWAINEDVDIINMSFGIPTDSPSLKEAIDMATEKGILVVAAAGNGGNDADVLYPAAYDNVLGVGSVDSQAELSEFSATGRGVDVVAPGENIVSSSMLNGIVACEGTSMSVPHVVGIASLLKQRDMSKDGKFLSALIKQSAHRLGDENEYGAGLVDAEYALEIYDEFAEYYHEQEVAQKDITVVSGESIVVDSNEDDIRLSEEFVNDNKIETSEVEEIVIGQWSNDENVHTGIVQDAYDKLGYYPPTAAQMQALRMGASFNDKKYNNGPSLYGLVEKTYGDNGDWHGNWKDDYDYVAAYYYVACLANSCDAAGKPKYDVMWDKRSELLGNEIANGVFVYNGESRKYIKKAQYNRMKERFTDVWGTLQDHIKSHNSSCSKNLYISGNEMRFFYIGMALHIVADIFAHSAFAYITYKESANVEVSEWLHLIHPDSDSEKQKKRSNKDKARSHADDISFRTYRKKAAIQVCSNVLSRSLNVYMPDASVFALSRTYYNPNAAQGFMISKLYDRVISKGVVLSQERTNALIQVTEGQTIFEQIYK